MSDFVLALTTLPADFDSEGFARLAKMLFIRMQAANDSASRPPSPPRLGFNPLPTSTQARGSQR